MIGSPGWKPYLDLLLKDPGVKTAGLYGREGQPWAAQDDMAVTSQEVRDLVAGFADTSKLTQNGVVLVGVRYMYLNTVQGAYPSPPVLFARKSATTALVTITKRALIVVMTKDGYNSANVTSHLGVAADLLAKGF